MAEQHRILTPKDRQQRNREEVSAAILEVARSVMRENGVADLNLQEIARRVGMRAPSLYNYFPSRNAIYEALFVEGMRLYRTRLESIFAAQGATWAGLRCVMEAYLSFAQENPELYQLLFERPVPGFVPSAEGLAEGDALIGLAGQMTDALIANGTLQPAAPGDVVMNLLMALMHGMTALHLANEPEKPLGAGRFGSLIPVLLDLLRRAWGQPQ